MKNLAFTFDHFFNSEKSVYQVEDYTHVFETDLLEDDDQNICLLQQLFEEDLRKAVIQIADKYFKEVVEGDLEKYKINYTIFDFGPNNLYFIIEPSNRKQFSYVLNLFYKVSIVNEIGMICLGGNPIITFKKLKQNKLEKLLKTESWVPVCTLVESSGCAFIRYDGALLSIAERGNKFFEKYSS